MSVPLHFVSNNNQLAANENASEQPFIVMASRTAPQNEHVEINYHFRWQAKKSYQIKHTVYLSLRV
jgi:hypothetical protein